MDNDSHTALQTQTCKIPGCPHDAVARMGKFAGLCSDHIDTRRRAEANGVTRVTSTTRPSRSGGRPGLAEKVKTLGKVGRDVDKLRDEATKLTERALTAKARADEAEREFEALARELMGVETSA